MTDKELLTRIARSAGQKTGYKQLVRELSLGSGMQRRLLLEQLARMAARGALVKLDREHWSIPKTISGAGGTRDNLAAGRLDLHRDGYGFVRPNARQSTGQEDIFIPPNEINGAMQGDQVLVELEPPKSDGRRMGRIARVLERRNPTIVGIFHYDFLSGLHRQNCRSIKAAFLVEHGGCSRSAGGFAVHALQINGHVAELTVWPDDIMMRRGRRLVHRHAIRVVFHLCQRDFRRRRAFERDGSDDIRRAQS